MPGQLSFEIAQHCILLGPRSLVSECGIPKLPTLKNGGPRSPISVLRLECVSVLFLDSLNDVLQTRLTGVLRFYFVFVSDLTK